MKRLENKVVIVTGSTSGIGIGIARLCAAEGAKVVVCGRREDKGNAVVETITKEGGEAWFHRFDITKLDTIDSLLKAKESILKSPTENSVHTNSYSSPSISGM